MAGLHPHRIIREGSKSPVLCFCSSNGKTRPLYGRVRGSIPRGSSIHFCESSGKESDRRVSVEARHKTEDG